jgi:hypothetical protein
VEPDVIPFLQALGLQHDADERAVRRAYAQRLKRIDPAADPQGFQALRSDYENALRWVAFQAQRRAAAADEAGEAGEAGRGAPVAVAPAADASAADAAAPVVASAGAPAAAGAVNAPANEVANDGAHAASAGAADLPAPGAERDPGTEALAAGEQVFAAFAQRAEAPFTDEAAARQALAQALADERLVNLEARTFFEWRVARLLMDGWRPGHEFLLGPACEAFNWEDDRRRLTLFGPLGAALDAAINEKLIFHRLSPGQFEAQRALIRRLRNDSAPSAGTLVDEMPLLQALVERYPHWLRVITSRDNVIRWHQEFEALPPERRAKARKPQAGVPAPRPAAPAKSSTPWWLIGIGLFLAVKLLSGLGSLGDSPQRRYMPPAQDMRLPAGDSLLPQRPGSPFEPRLFDPLSGLPAAAPPAPKGSASAPAVRVDEARLKQIIRAQEERRRQREQPQKPLTWQEERKLEQEVQNAQSDALRALMLPPLPQAAPPAARRSPIPPVPPVTLQPAPGAADDSVLTRHRNERLDDPTRYELVPRNPDGSTSSPRL